MPMEFSERRAPLLMDELHHLVSSNKNDSDEQHARLRADLDRLTARMGNVDATLGQNAIHLTRIDNTPVQAAKLSFSPGTILTIVGICLAVAGGQWAATYDLRSDVRDIKTSMAAQSDVDRVSTKLQDERAINTAKTIETIDKKLELQNIKIEGLRLDVSKVQQR